MSNIRMCPSGEKAHQALLQHLQQEAEAGSRHAQRNALAAKEQMVEIQRERAAEREELRETQSRCRGLRLCHERVERRGREERETAAKGQAAVEVLRRQLVEMRNEIGRMMSLEEARIGEEVALHVDLRRMLAEEEERGRREVGELRDALERLTVNGQREREEEAGRWKKKERELMAGMRTAKREKEEVEEELAASVRLREVLKEELKGDLRKVSAERDQVAQEVRTLKILRSQAQESSLSLWKVVEELEAGLAALQRDMAMVVRAREREGAREEARVAVRESLEARLAAAAAEVADREEEWRRKFAAMGARLRGCVAEAKGRLEERVELLSRDVECAVAGVAAVGRALGEGEKEKEAQVEELEEELVQVRGLGFRV